MGVESQLYEDNLKCVSRDPDLLLSAAKFTTGCVRLVGQEPALSKCVLFSTSRDVWRNMGDWVLSKESDKSVTGGLSSVMSVILGVIWILPFGDCLHLGS